MIKHFNEDFEETYYEGSCDNGLRVVIWHKKDYHTSSCLLGVPYGSLDLNQQDDKGNIIRMPSGIAHFLEHKLFESDHSDVMEEFSKLGCNVNAFTSYEETCYYFDTSAQNIDKPLELLLDFVQSLNITDASVEKEKGIIDQELQMYLQMPDSRVVFETFKALYHKHPLRNDIGGSHDSVYATNRKQLEDCYHMNYHPQNMYLIIATPLDPKHLFNVINENQKRKQFGKFISLKRYIEKEEENVFKTNAHVQMDIEIPRVALGIKLKINDDDINKLIKDEWILRMMLEAHFSSMNKDFQKWIDEKKISPLFYYDNENAKDHSLMIFVDETKDAEGFVKFINQQLLFLKENNINKKSLDQLKNRYYGSVMRTFNKVENITIQHFRNMKNGLTIFALLKIIESISVEDCYNLYHNLNIDNQSLVIIDKNSEN